MKRTILTALGLLATVVCAHAQTTAQFDPTNAREGESVEYCRTHVLQQELMQDPEAVARYQQNLALMQQEEQNPVATPKGVVYYIPVVFHVLHNYGIENITDEQIHDALSILNRDFRRLNADANLVHADFLGLPADVEIEFRLATKAPNGECFNGITRTVDPITDDGSSGGAQVSAIIAGNDVYNGQWPGDEYLNFFVCGNIGGAAGYTFLPIWGGSGMGNGIWILHNYVGSIGTGNTQTSRALTHEVGHWLNLPHPWGNNNNPGNASSCSADDGVADTPNTIGVTSCNLNENSCGPRANVENYMDYSYCTKMFTPGQVTRMRTAITSGISGRNNVISSSNLINTGATGVLELCKADFDADRTTICAGEEIQFTDGSFNAVTGWDWSFTGGAPATSTDQNPLVTYDTPGLYAVTLNATDGGTSDSETKTAYIRVLPAPSSLPFLDGFEDYTTFVNIEEWEVFNPSGNGFESIGGIAHTGNRCARLRNFGQPAGETDELISAPVDLSGVDPATDDLTLSFRYAYSKRSAGNDEWLKVFISGDCGGYWAQRKTIHGDFLSSNVQGTNWEPSTQDDWVTVHMTNVTQAFYTDRFRYKFEFESDNGNNFYLDDINIYKGTPSDDLVVGLNESGLDITSLTVYPNPADEELNVKFSLQNADKTTLYVQDVSGKIVKATTVNGTVGKNIVMIPTAELAQGMYFLNIQSGSSQKTLQFVVK